MSTNPTSRLVACIWLPNWPVQRLRAARVVLSGQPLVLYAARPQGGLQISACCRLARQAGVACGMTLAEALSLLKTDSGREVCTLAHDPLADRQALQQLAGWCERFSPLVGCESTAEPHSLLCDLSRVDVAGLFGSVPAWKQQVEQAFTRRGLRPRVAVGATVGSAWAVAHFAPASVWQATHEMLLNLPLAALRLATEAEQTLLALGISHVGQLTQLPRATLHARFGDEVLLRLDQTLGQAAETFVAHPAAPRWVYDWQFEHATDRPEALRHAIEILLQRLTADLAPLQLGVLRLLCRFAADQRPLLVLNVGVYQATALVRHLVELVQLQLENQRLRAAVETITLAAVQTAKLAVEQHTLFDEVHRGSPRDLAALVDRLATRLGDQNVVRPVRVADPQPEAAFRYVSLVGKSTSRRRNKAEAASLAPPAGQDAPRPISLWPPQALVVVCAAEGPPARFHWQGEEHRVVQAWGPERIETGWWRWTRGTPGANASGSPLIRRVLPLARRASEGTATPRICRDYYRVETDRGAHLWLFRQRTDGRWFCHGSFD